MTSVHSSAVGSIQIVCGPGGTVSVPNVRGLSLSSVVASSAPGHHTRPYGTSAPKMVRPRIDGRPYVIVIVAPCTDALTLSCGRGRAFCPAALAAIRTVSAADAVAIENVVRKGWTPFTLYSQ